MSMVFHQKEPEKAQQLQQIELQTKQIAEEIEDIKDAAEDNFTRIEKAFSEDRELGDQEMEYALRLLQMETKNIDTAKAPLWLKNYVTNLDKMIEKIVEKEKLK